MNENVEGVSVTANESESEAKSAETERIEFPSAIFAEGKRYACEFGTWRYSTHGPSHRRHTECEVVAHIDHFNATTECMRALRRAMLARDGRVQIQIEDDAPLRWDVVCLRAKERVYGTWDQPAVLRVLLRGSNVQGPCVPAPVRVPDDRLAGER